MGVCSMGKEEPITMWKVSESQGTFFNIARWGAWIRQRSVLCSVLVTQCIYMWRNPRSKKFYWAKTACHLITVWGYTKASFEEKKAAFVCAVCLVCELLSDTRLSPAVCARWAPSACLSYSQRFCEFQLIKQSSALPHPDSEPVAVFDVCFW